MQTPNPLFLSFSFFARTIAFCVVATTGVRVVPAATFAPTPLEMSALSKGAAEVERQIDRAERGTDETGREFLALDDRRYPAAGAQLDSAFTGNLWTGGTVYYQFAPSVTASNRVAWRGAATGWKVAAATLNFVESTGSGNYIYVQNSSGNNSYVGMIGGSQEMNIAQWYKPVMMHEIGHALGLEHEQCRSDRDSYVVIRYANIEAGHASNFDLMSSVNYGPYDFGSIMHYSRLAFSANGQNTVEPLPLYSAYLYSMGEGSDLSSLDASGMAARYNRPPNDLFANRIPIKGNRGGVAGSNAGTSRESGEPTHWGNAGGSSVWYTWTAPGTGAVTIDTFGSNFDTVLGVYTGTTVASLTLVASNDDATGTQSSVTFSATAGASYQIAVDGYGEAQGAIKLNWRSERSRPDLSGDGQADLIWQNNATGERLIWLMNGLTKTAQRAVPTVPTTWQIAGLGMFNAHEQMDIVWQNTSTGQLSIWIMNGPVKTGERALPSVPTGWQIATTGDFNADGQTDLVWQHTSTGQRTIWLMNGTTRIGERALPTIPTSWKIAAAADFNSDGRPDLLWQNNATGQRSIWLMNGTVRTSDRALPTVPTQWQIAGADDFNSDGQVDILWQNISTGQRSVWLMNGTARTSERFLPTTPVAWEIRNH